ncbi:hypothetical protein GCE9029_00610 [Grimontia celer]|uniref:Lipoprotein n=1 Tax=Grimontia celer TaxID=1796497 RepID=A0A128EV94_9GAMM|nr:hypothetical protein [Grimontia celer]CZF78085.1 hypothetical protein GCE9029_00610 [Grimontia celer]
MKLQRTLLATAIAISLAACGSDSSSSSDSGSTTEPTTTSLSGKAADGYLQDALVCLDINLNKACDSDEPSATTDENGAFSLEATKTQIDSAPLLVEVIAGQTIDSDNPGVALNKGYTLTAPAASDFISPITTLIQNEIEKGATLEESVVLVKAQLGTDADITSDYIEGKSSDTQQAEFERLHKVAQVTARVIATKLDELKNDATNNGVSNADLINVINEEVSKVVSDIVNDVSNVVGDFDPDAVANTSKDKVDLSGSNIKDKVDDNNADRNKISASIKQLVETEGLAWFAGNSPEGGTPTLEYGEIEVDGQGNVVETMYKSNDDLSAFVAQVAEQTTLLMLTSAGWQLADGTIVDITSVSDGVDKLVTQSADLSEIVATKKVDVSGFLVKNVMSKTADNGVWSNFIAEDTKFPDGTFAYELSVTPAVAGYFTVYPGTWCGENTVGGMCNSLSLENGNGPSTPLETLDSLVKQAPDGTATNTTLMGGLAIGEYGGGLVTEVLADGTVNYYTWDYAMAFSDVIGTGTWKDTTILGKVVREITAPTEVLNHPDLTWSNFDRAKGNAYLTEVDGYVRLAASTSTEASKEYVLGKESVQMVIESINYQAPAPAPVEN